MSRAKDNPTGSGHREDAATHRPRPAGSKPRKGDRQRVQMDLTPEVFDRVFHLQLVNGLDSMRAVFREGFRLYEWFTIRRMEGWKLQLVHEDGTIAHVDLGLIGERSKLKRLMDEVDGHAVETEEDRVGV